MSYFNADRVRRYATGMRDQSRNITTALRAVEDMDSDGNGDTNIVEITARTLPGDSLNSTPIEKTTWGTIKNMYQ
jgi:hypothetical protein